ncbi:MAG: Type 1 glutamine amidotransferase-like domain-containing protein [Clostridia bacterium]|nr:Type 1 glutamine amidotransferase-like domain-containing protein [Clostridia bacterium]
MKLFLTSEIGATTKINGKRCTGKIDNRYGFLDLLRIHLHRTERMIYISAYAEDQLRITEWFSNTIEALKNESIFFKENILINGKNAHLLKRLLTDTDVVFLSGGHLPTQNSFFADICLGGLLKNYDGIIIAQSAGSMNCASTVYVCPEIPGEATDPEFRRFRSGLGLTDLHVIPHYNKNRHMLLDGMKFYEDVIAPDTFRVPLYLLMDGSFVYIEDDHSPVPYGDIFRFYRGEIKRIGPDETF